MTVGDLIKHLKQFDDKTEVVILDGFNGGGSQRAINLTPHLRRNSGGDIATKTGEVVVMGFGCY